MSYRCFRMTLLQNTARPELGIKEPRKFASCVRAEDLEILSFSRIERKAESGGLSYERWIN
jgi:hypothetical protein